MTLDPCDGIPAGQVELVSAKVRALPGFPDFPACAPAYTHIGALLTDAGLQAGIDYNAVVAPRVARMLARWPDAATVSAFLERISKGDLKEIIDWQDGEKPRRIRRMAELLAKERIETVEDLARWIQESGSHAKLISLRGVGEKTADYIGNLAGQPILAVDVRLRRFVADSGVNVESYSEIHRLLACVAQRLGVNLGALDRAIWQAVGKEGTDQGQPDRPDTVPPLAVSDADVARLEEDLRRAIAERDEARRVIDEIRRLLPDP